MRLFLILVMVSACTGTPSGATCPTDNAPTYDTFARPFMTKYCTGCHSAQATNRHGAPSDQNYDSEADVLAHADAIDEVAASGPNATNTSMPELGGPVHSQPTREEREMLGQFLACTK